MEVRIEFDGMCWHCSGHGRVWERCSCGGCSGCTPDWETLPICPACKGTGKVPTPLGNDLIEFLETHFDLKRKE